MEVANSANSSSLNFFLGWNGFGTIEVIVISFVLFVSPRFSPYRVTFLSPKSDERPFPNLLLLLLVML